MKRREFLKISAFTGVAANCSHWASAVALDQPLALENAAAEAWLYGLMLLENARARSEALATAKPNTLAHTYKLATPESRSITTPNNDTLYSRAWIDLAAGPVTLTMPNVGDRYVSYAFMDMYGNNFAILGSRTTGGAGGKVTLIGPAVAATDKNAIRSPTRWVWLLIRLLVDNDDDVPVANALQNKMRLTGQPAAVPRTYAKRSDPWPEYFASVQALVLENPPPITDMGFFKRITALGLSAHGGFDAKKFSEADGQAITNGLALARKQLATTGGVRIADGWVYPKSSLGNYGQDYLYRAQVALFGLAALTPVEAMYIRPVASDGTYLLPSAATWRLHFDKERLPPVNAFWSLSMYQPTPDGQFFFFNNPSNRYAIGDRTKGLKYNSNGSLDIWIARNDPGADRHPNWLPAPPTEKFAVFLRAYLPRPELLDGDYRVPTIERVQR
jgi:hypothetical protein